MGKSILQDDRRCYFCNRVTGLEKHHVFAGIANRRISEARGFWVMCCNECHTGRDGVQYNKEKNLRLKQDAQRAFEKDHTHQEWMDLIRKNYL